MNLLDLMVTIGIADEASPKLNSISNKLGNGLRTAAQIGTKAVAAASVAIGIVTKQSLQSFAEYEQLAGGVEKIFGEALSPQMFADAQEAYKNLNMSANDYLSMINNIGATFAQTMGAEAGYETAKRGMQAIADFASGTGKSVGLLSEKFMMITRSAGAYQSIADQFAGVLPATSANFLEQAQAAGYLEKSYKSLTEVPIEEYQSAVALMLEEGVANLNLTNNTVQESFKTLRGSIAATKAAWSNLVAGFANENANFEQLIGNFTTSFTAAFENIQPRLVQIFQGLSTVAATLIPQMVAMITENLGGLLEAGTQIVTALGGAIMQNLPTLITTALEVIMSLVTYMSANAEQFVPVAVAIILAISGTLLESAPELLAAMGTLMGQLMIAIIQNIPGILAAGAELITALIVSLQAAVNQFNEVVGEWLNAMIDKIKELLQNFVEAGSQIVDSIKAGIASAWESLVNWFEAKWSALFGNRSVSVGVSYGGGTTSSNAIGLDRVPYNGYIAELHKDEAVLNAREASQWRNGLQGGKNQPIIFNINNVTELDGAVIARKTYSYNLAEQTKHGPKLINT